MKKILLVLLFAFSAFAGESEEIGVPYFSISYDNNIGSKIQSASFSLDGNNMYTLLNGLVTVYQTNPMKKVFSFQVDIDPEFVHQPQQIFITKDKKRIVIYCHGSIRLWDIQTKKCLKNIKTKTNNAVNTMYGLTILTNDYFLEVLDDQNLEVVSRSKYQVKMNSLALDDEDPWTVTAGGMTANQNIILLRFLDGVMFVNLETFKIIDQVSHGSDITPYLEKYSSIFKADFLTEFMTSSYNKSRHLLIYSFQSSNSSKDLIVLYLQYRPDRQHSNNHLVITGYHQEKKERYRFWQFGEEWVMDQLRSNIFTGSSNITKYHKMIGKDRQVVPMNDATFEKYNQPLNIKAN